MRQRRILSGFMFGILGLLLINTSCNWNSSFNREEMRFVASFTRDELVVFESETGQLDTVRFFQWKVDTIRKRSFGQGYYNENVLLVGYELTPGSFHKFPESSSSGNYDDLILFLKSKGHSHKEIKFLGLIFDQEYVEQKLKSKDELIVFDGEQAQYRDMNINEGIRRFSLDLRIGVISFVDKNEQKWTRRN